MPIQWRALIAVVSLAVLLTAGSPAPAAGSLLADGAICDDINGMADGWNDMADGVDEMAYQEFTEEEGAEVDAMIAEAFEATLEFSNFLIEEGDEREARFGRQIDDRLADLADAEDVDQVIEAMDALVDELDRLVDYCDSQTEPEPETAGEIQVTYRPATGSGYEELAAALEAITETTTSLWGLEPELSQFEGE